MPAKSKKRGQTVSLDVFTGNTVKTGEYDWVEEEWDPEADVGTGGNNTDKTTAMRRAIDTRYKHDGTKLGVEVGFRDAPEERCSKMIPKDMPPPYVAHFNNLANGITEEELRDEFHPDVVTRVKLISKERSTFAFIEFTTVDALYAAILMDGKIIKKRPVRVDVATKDQIDRMNRPAQEGRSGPSRDGMGSGQPGGVPLDRDAFGAQQPQQQPAFFGGRMRGNHSTGNLDGEGAENQGITRDAFGANTAKPADFGEWRNAGPAQQPQLRENRRSDDGVDRRGERRDRKPAEAQPSSAAAFDNWRSEGPVAQPPMRQNSDSAEHPTSPDRKEGAKGPTRVFTRQNPSSPPAGSGAAPAAQESGNRWENLRK